MNQHNTVYVLNYTNENRGESLTNIYSTYEKAEEAFFEIIKEKCPDKTASFYEEARSRREFYNDETMDWCGFFGAEVL